MRKFIYLIRRFFYRIRMNWAYIKYFVFKDNSDGYIESLQEFLFYQLTHISKQLIKTKGVEDKKRLLNFLWECRKALEAYTSGKVEDVASDIDNSLFKKKFKIDIPDIGMECGEGNRLHVTYKYPDAVDEETKKQMDEYLHSKERTQSQVDNFRSLNAAYLQDFLNKLGAVIDSFEY